MMNINLLPWREKKAEQQKRYSQYLSGVCFIFAILIVVIIHTVLTTRIESLVHQANRWQRQLFALTVRTKTVHELEKQYRQRVEAGMLFERVAQDQISTLKFFSALIGLVPSSVSFSAIRREGQVFSVQGQTQTTSALMQFMEKLSVVQPSRVTQLVEGDKKTAQCMRFQLQSRQNNQRVIDWIKQ